MPLISVCQRSVGKGQPVCHSDTLWARNTPVSALVSSPPTGSPDRLTKPCYYRLLLLICDCLTPDCRCAPLLLSKKGKQSIGAAVGALPSRLCAACFFFVGGLAAYWPWLQICGLVWWGYRLRRFIVWKLLCLSHFRLSLSLQGLFFFF